MTTLEQRPQFYEHQYLEAADLTAVVSYSRAQLARTQLGAHRWGIALGLELQEVSGPNSTLDVFVQPGYAWDGFGRPIVVPEPHRISGALFAAIDAEFVPGNPPRPVEVWLGYSETPTNGPRPGFEECDHGPSFARVVESFRVEVGRRTLEAQRDPIEIAGRTFDAALALRTFDASAPELADASVPHQTFPADGEPARWLVPIGVVSWEPGNPGRFFARDQPALNRHRTVRQYAGAVAGSIEASGGHVRVHDRAKPYNPAYPPDELLFVEGDLGVDGTTRLYGHRLEFVRSLTETPRRPFHLARRDDVTGARLQVVIGDEAAGANRFAVGRRTGVDAATNEDTHAEDFVVTDEGRVGIGTTEPKALLHLKEDGLQIGTSAIADDNFHVQANTDGPRGLRIYNKDMGAGSHLATFTQGGRFGVGTTDPTNMVHIEGDLGLRQNRLYLSGGTRDWSSVTFNAHRSGNGQSWVFPDPGKPAVTIEMDAVDGGPPRFEVYSTAQGANTSWRSRFKVFGHSGNVGMALEGNVGIGTYAPAAKLDVNGEIAFASGLRPVGAASGVRVVWGRVTSSGAVAAGDGFTVVRQGAGRYQVSFTTPFPSPPAVVVTKVWLSFEASDGTNVKPRENAILDQVVANSVIVATCDQAGTLGDSNFCFLAIGPR